MSKETVKWDDVQVGSLVGYCGGMFLVPYANSPITLLHVGKSSHHNGHGYTTKLVEVTIIAPPKEFDLVPIEKGVLKHVVGKVVTRKQLREMLESSGDGDACGDQPSSNAGRRRMHHCSCVDCPGHKVLI